MWSLAFLLEGICASPWQEVAWSFSRLTGDGYPVEFAFSSADEAIRYTTEVAGPEVEEHRRLDHALHCLARLGEPHLPEEILALFRGIQMSRPLRYGAWVGARHDAEGDRSKVYVEVPRVGESDAYPLLSALIGDVPVLSICRAQLVMLGYGPSASQIEAYFRTDRLEPWQVDLLMGKSGFASQTQRFFDFVEEVSGLTIQRIVSMQPLGFSFAGQGTGIATTFSLFMAAGSVFGSDMNIRQRMLALDSRMCWRLTHYRAASESLAGRTGWNTWHGILSFVARRDEAPVLHIGLRPPDTLAETGQDRHLAPSAPAPHS
jgi:hypothetical protein